MRILLLHDPYLPVTMGAVGGEDNVAKLEIETISKRGHEVIDGRLMDSGIGKKLNQLRAQTIGSNPDVIEKIRAANPDVIHTHNLNQRSGYSWMSQNDIPVVSSIHNYRLFCPSSIAYRSGHHCLECRDHGAIKAIQNSCDGIRGTLNASRHLVFQRANPQINIPAMFLISSNLMESVLDPIIPKSKFRLLRNPGTIPTQLAFRTEIRDGWIFAGRLIEEKGILDLIINWPDNEKLDIAGDGPLRQPIAQLIAERSNIELIGTYPPGENSIFSKYEGLIFSSKWFEGSPLVTMECLATGTPIICTDQSGASEQVAESKGGVVIAGALSRNKLTEAQAEIRANFDLYSRNAVAAISGEFSVESWGRKLEGYLKEAVELTS
jgi:glycosyltransferase involved in cell wall biosynthesis